MDNQIKGYRYEIQVRDYIINKLHKKAYLWNDTPETLLINSGIIGNHNENRLRRIENKINNLRDTGIDIIQEETETLCSIIQCKNGYKNGITMNDLGGFMSWMFSLEDKKIKGYVYYTSKISYNLKYLPSNKRLEYVKYDYTNIDNDNENTNKDINNNGDNNDNNINYNNNDDNINIKPYDYQLEAVNKLYENYCIENRGILSMPCGTGKTLTSYLLSKNYKQIVIISPLKQFAKQNLDRYIEYGYSGNYLLIDTDGTRDINEIKKFIYDNNDNGFLLSSTYCSIDIIAECLELFNDVLFIVDEFHNLSKNNLFEETDNFYKLLMSHHKILFISATPRIYQLEDEYEDIDDNTDKIFGKIIYNMMFNEAIKNKYITDYRIWLPVIHENNEELDNELTIYDIDATIKNKCKYLFSCLLNNGSKKCIVYCVDIQNIEDMMNGMKELNEFYCMNIHMDKIISSTGYLERTEILKRFESISDNVELLFSVRILDECIDIPKCDSIYINYPSNSKIRTIQRLSRCIRLDKNNPYKVANVYIWCDKYDQILNTLSGIKEFDIYFNNKIKLNENNFYGKINNKLIANDNKVINNYILGIKEFIQQTWYEKLELAKEYIVMNNKRPSLTDKDIDVKRLGYWLHRVKNDYENNKGGMKDINKKQFWKIFMEEYGGYMMNFNETWNDKLLRCIEFFNEFKRRPTKHSNDENEKELGNWLIAQKIHYSNKEYIMKNEEIREKWRIFTDNYKEYFMENDEVWFKMLNEVKNYIDNNKKRPNYTNTDPYIKKLACWLIDQQRAYLGTHNKYNLIILKNEYIKQEWEKFKTEYYIYLRTYEEIWNDSLNDLINYIDLYKEKPKKSSVDTKVKYLYQWISDQKKKQKADNFKNIEMKNKWIEFTQNYSKYI